MAGKYIGIAQDILSASSGEGLRPEQVAEIVGRGSGGNINCYPGNPGHGCYPLAVFVSLSGKLKRCRRWPHSFDGILNKIVDHMEKSKCRHITKEIVLVTDSWWAPSFEKRRRELMDIVNDVNNLEIYLISYPNLIKELRIY